MKTNQKLLLSFVLMLVAQLATAGVPQKLVVAFQTGNSQELSVYFHEKLELVIDGKEGIYSKNQAEQIVQRYFIEHVPQKFEVVHEGGKTNSKYAIGSLKTSKGVYRVYFLLKFVDDKPLIHQLRIELDND